MINYDSIKNNILELRNIFNNRYNKLSNNHQNPIMIWHGDKWVIKDELISTFMFNNINTFFNDKKEHIMSNFIFDKDDIKIINQIVFLENKSIKNIIGIKVHKNKYIPLHLDDVENKMRLTIIINNINGHIFMTDDMHKSEQVIKIGGLNSFIFNPSIVWHGAVAIDSDLDIIQIQI